MKTFSPSKTFQLYGIHYSLRGAGGSFGKKEKAIEDQYFHNLVSACRVVVVTCTVPSQKRAHYGISAHPPLWAQFPAKV